MEYISREECKQIQTNILLELDRICRAENLHYYIAYGTLLGAVRHGGFIPWDDDIDICMLRKDYEKLLKIIKSGRVSWISIVDGDYKSYYLPFAKAVDNRTIAKQEDTKQEHGIWVDIFPMDGIPASGLRQKWCLKKAHLLRDALVAAITDFDSEKSKNDPKRFIKKVFSFAVNLCGGVDKVYNYTINYHKSYHYEKTGLVGCFGTPYTYKEKLQLSDIKSTKDYTFEGHQVIGLSDSDKYLKMLYGDYMKLPPESNRKSHSIIAWYK